MTIKGFLSRSNGWPFMLLAALCCTHLTGAEKSTASNKLSAFDRVEYCDLAAGADGAFHAIFTERPAYDRPCYMYLRTSTDNGKTWSAPNNLSDDESGDDASYARIIVDGSGRIYAVWKYVRKSTLLDGPGGTAPGRLVFRSFAGGAWSKRVSLTEAKIPAFSWFAATAPDGAVHVVWSQITADTPSTYVYANYANLIRQAALDGPAIKSVKDLTVPKPILTDAMVKELRAANKPIKYEDTQPKMDGLIDLRGYIDGQGTAHFSAEHPGIQSGPSNQQTGRRIVVWDGTKMNPVYEFEKYKTYNNFNNPPVLAVDGKGRPHLIRAPEKSEKPCVRDYTVNGAELGDFTNVIIPKSGPGKLANWQVHALPGGKLAVTAALSEKGGYDPDDLELYVSLFDGASKWSAPVIVTSNQSKKSGFNKETTPGNTIGSLKSHKPRFAAVVLAKDGKPCILMVDNEDTIVGVTSAGVTSSGRAVTGTGSLRTDNPAVYFIRL